MLLTQGGVMDGSAGVAQSRAHLGQGLRLYALLVWRRPEFGRESTGHA